MSTIHVGNISNETRTRDLDKLFSKCGDIRDIRSQRDYSFIDFYRTKDAEYAVREFDNYKLHGNRLRVELARNSRRSASGCFKCGKLGHKAAVCRGRTRSRSYSRSRSRSRSYSRSRSRSYSRSRSRSYSSRSRSRSYSRSRSGSDSKSRSRSRSPNEKKEKNDIINKVNINDDIDIKPPMGGEDTKAEENLSKVDNLSNKNKNE